MPIDSGQGKYLEYIQINGSSVNAKGLEMSNELLFNIGNSLSLGLKLVSDDSGNKICRFISSGFIVISFASSLPIWQLMSTKNGKRKTIRGANVHSIHLAELAHPSRWAIRGPVASSKNCLS